MKCPYCKMNDTRVVDSRPSPDGLSVRRRRRCETCGKRITTFETVKLTMPQILKSDGRRQDFVEEKLHASVRAALGKESSEGEALEELMDRIRFGVFRKDKKQMPSVELGRIVIEELKETSPMASFRYASLKARYRDLDVLGEEIARLQRLTATRSDDQMDFFEEEAGADDNG